MNRLSIKDVRSQPWPEHTRKVMAAHMAMAAPARRRVSPLRLAAVWLLSTAGPWLLLLVAAYLILEALR